MNTNHDYEGKTTSSKILVQMLTDEEYGHETTEAFFKSEFLASAVDALFSARHQAGLTQAQVANRLNTKQAAIARLEADTTGSMSLRRYVEVALACGMVPLDITLVPISSARDYVIECPQDARTADAYTLWAQAKVQQERLTVTANPLLTSQHEPINFEKSSDQLLHQPSQNWPRSDATTLLAASKATTSQMNPVPTLMSQNNLLTLKKVVA